MRPPYVTPPAVNLFLRLSAALLGSVAPLSLLPLLTPAALAQAGGTMINLPGIGRVTVNADGTINLPGGGVARLNADGTVTLPNGQIITLTAIPGAGGGGGGVNPAATDPSIVAANGILAGADAIAAVVIPGGAGGGATPTIYLWSIIGGRFIDTNLTRNTVIYTADTAGTAKLSCIVTVSGKAAFTATTDVTIVDPAIAGAITTPPTAAASTTAASTATLPAAQNTDRTFRWSVSGSAARITAGATTNQITFVPGDAGVKELTCVVTFTALRLPVTLRAFLVVQGSGPAVALSINGGFGSGTYPSGSRVDIFAATPLSGQVFDRWVGDTAALGTGVLAPFVAHLLLTVPATSVTLTATYKAAPTWTPLTVAAFNPQTYTPTGAGATPSTVSAALAYYIPPGATAVVFLLHDTGAAAADWFAAPESALLLRELVSAGYGVAALSSFNRTSRAWNGQALLANNPDALNHVAALNKFAADGLLPATRPVFLLGLAAGADTAVRFAQLLATASPARPVRGTVLYCASGNETDAVVSRVPAFYLLANNDSVLAANGARAARTNSLLLAGRGLPTAVIDNLPAPLHSGRFRALGVTNPAFTNAAADAVWTSIKNAGLIDANNYVKAIPTETALVAAIPAAYQSRRADVAAQLDVAYSEQAFFADANARVLAWIAARVAGTAAPTAGRLVNLSTRLKLAAAGETLTFGFTLTGSEKATVLIRGIGPTLGAFGVPGTLAAPRLEVNQDGKLLTTNEGWDKSPVTPTGASAIAAAAASVGAFALAPGSADCAVLLSLSPGGYTATFRGVNGATGEVLAEIYDVTKSSTRLTNLATLARIANPGDLITAGITVVGDQPRSLIVRGVGPGLTELGVPGALADPTLTVLSSATATVAAASVAANNNWGTGGSQASLTAAFPAIGAFSLKTGSSDAGLVHAFTSGGYSVQASAAAAPANQVNPPAPTGLLLIEVYEAP